MWLACFRDRLYSTSWQTPIPDISGDNLLQIAHYDFIVSFL